MRRQALAIWAMAVFLGACQAPADPVYKGEEVEVEMPLAGFDEGEDKAILRVAVLEGGYGTEMWQEVVDAFEEQMGNVTVELTIDRKVEEIISAEIEEGVWPDVVHLAIGREAGLTERLIEERALMPLTEVFESNVPCEIVPAKEKILPGFLDTVGTNPYGDDVTYLAPMFYSPCGLFYNAALLEEKGWALPLTWEDMWALGEAARKDGVALFTYPTAGYFDALFFAMLTSSGGFKFYNDVMTYQDGVWESQEARDVLEIVGRLAEYTEASTMDNANAQGFLLNQQLVLDNKAIFIPNGTWLPKEMEGAPRDSKFRWAFRSVPPVKPGNKPSSYTIFEQMWIPAKAQEPEMAKAFVGFMYSNVAARIFAAHDAAQPIAGVADYLSPGIQAYYRIYDKGAVAVMGGFATAKTVGGTTMAKVLFDNVNAVMRGELSIDQWQADLEAASDRLRASR